jgi:hypothetical protein
LSYYFVERPIVLFAKKRTERQSVTV